MSKVEEVTRRLRELSSICDTGYALAIHIRFTSPTLLYQTYPDEWIRFYTERGFMLSDPVVRWGLRETGFIRWNDIPDEDHEAVMVHARQHGIAHGVAFSLGTPASRTLAGLTRSQDEFTGDEIDRMIGLVSEIHDLTREPGDDLATLRSLTAASLR
ncbi:autoinducer binding domain-containing protein [Cereibacter sp. SYSU M97828]|nr:autoinducer binding domain-containing protein [Cereibacter flavus]